MLAQLRGTSLVAEHWQSARMAANLLLADWSNETPNLWKVDKVTTPLVQGTATYTVDAKTIMILDAYRQLDNGLSDPIDSIITPVSRSEYASYPNKDAQGLTTVYWFDRLISPTITLWQVPDGTSATNLVYYRVTQVMDAEFANGGQVDIPYRWFNAFADGMALNLARLWNPQLIPALLPFADKSYARAAKQDVEGANLYVSPMISGYYRP